jgi:hypothetical protein
MFCTTAEQATLYCIVIVQCLARQDNAVREPKLNVAGQTGTLLDSISQIESTIPKISIR